MGGPCVKGRWGPPPSQSFGPLGRSANRGGGVPATRSIEGRRGLSVAPGCTATVTPVVYIGTPTVPALEFGKTVWGTSGR
eukprot:8691980-Heterocapsa_arctica.AAC.1